jgi:hypothetical protein
MTAAVTIDAIVWTYVDDGWRLAVAFNGSRRRQRLLVTASLRVHTIDKTAWRVGPIPGERPVTPARLARDLARRRAFLLQCGVSHAEATTRAVIKALRNYGNININHQNMNHAHGRCRDGSVRASEGATVGLGLAPGQSERSRPDRRRAPAP